MRWHSAILISAMALVTLACVSPMGKVREAAERSKQQNDLKQLGLAIHNFQDQNGRTPKNFDELDKAGMLDNPEIGPQIRNGQVSVIWGFSMKKSADKIIAYRTASNGMIIMLFGDGKVLMEIEAVFGGMAKAVPATPDDDKDEKLPGVNR